MGKQISIKIPRTLDKFTDVNFFLKWLGENGGNIQSQTNAYEVIRVRGANKKTLVLYQKSNGILTWPQELMDEYRAFKQGQSWNGLIKVSKRKNTKSIKERLITDHGTECFYCLQEMGDDITLEHLLPKKYGGSNHHKNCVLAHEQCNREASTLSVYEKVLIRERNLGIEKNKAGPYG